MSENDGWQYQGRQEHGWFGNGTKPTDAAAKPGSTRAGLPARLRGGAGGGRSWRWPGSRLATEQRSQPVSPLPFAPLPLPNPYMGAVAAARAQRRWRYVAAEFARGDYGSVAAHLLLGKAFPAEVDNPELGDIRPAADDRLIVHSEPGEQREKPPVGSKGIDETPWSGDHTPIKQSVGADNDTNVKISPSGDVWVENPDGTWTNHGPARDFTSSGRPSGRRGKDRERR